MKLPFTRNKTPSKPDDQDGVDMAAGSDMTATAVVPPSTGGLLGFPPGSDQIDMYRRTSKLMNQQRAMTMQGMQAHQMQQVQQSYMDMQMRQARAENPVEARQLEVTARRNEVLKRMHDEAMTAERQTRDVTRALLRLIKGYSPRALAQALAQDEEANNIVHLAIALTPAFQPEETPRDPT